MTKDVVKRRRKSKIVLPVVYVFILVGIAVFGGIYFKKYNDLKNKPVDSQAVAEKEKQDTIAAVGKLYDIPKDEDPVIAGVTDKEQLKKQYPDFFNNIENGDKVLFYQNAGIAIAYRPSTNQLVKVGPLKIESASPSTKIIGAQTDRDSAEQTLKVAYKDKLVIKGKGDAKATYVGVTVVDVSGKNGELAKQLAASLKGQVGTLPSGEDKPSDADILIIAGTSAPAPSP